MNKFWLGMALTVTLLATGCGDNKGTTDSKQQANNAKKGDHAHHDEGPHGGHVIELGGDFHAELVHDDDAQTVTVYLLDADLKKPVLSDQKEITLNFTIDGQPQQFKLPASGEQGDLYSRYEAKDAKLIEALDAPNNKGRLRVSIGGENYDVELEHDHVH
jgi:hypothetical protein